MSFWEICQWILNQFDKNGTGYIEKEESKDLIITFYQMIGQTKDVSDFDNETLFFILDQDEDGRIGL
jgi:Ca2+-binding EF-hand superfamily protein